MSHAITTKIQTVIRCRLNIEHIVKCFSTSSPNDIIKKNNLTNRNKHICNLKFCDVNQRDPKELTHYRFFYGWLNNIFNQVDVARIKDVGPDRACAEWLLRCGAVVKWKGKEKEIKDYNSLPVGNFRTLKIESVDATDSAVMEAGFSHFKDLEHFHKLKLKNCTYLTDESIGHLVLNTKERLDWFELSDNGNVTDDGVKHLRKLTKLRYLKLSNLQGVKNPTEVLEVLKNNLPGCEIIYDDIN